jgi:hypothetical protein
VKVVPFPPSEFAKPDAKQVQESNDIKTHVPGDLVIFIL